MKFLSPSCGDLISRIVFDHQFHMGRPPSMSTWTPNQFWKVVHFRANFSPPESFLKSLKLFLSVLSGWSMSGNWCLRSICSACHSFMCSSAAVCQLNHLPLFTRDFFSLKLSSSEARDDHKSRKSSAVRICCLKSIEIKTAYSLNRSESWAREQWRNRGVGLFTLMSRFPKIKSKNWEHTWQSWRMKDLSSDVVAMKCWSNSFLSAWKLPPLNGL